MDLNSKSCVPELRLRFLRFPQPGATALYHRVLTISVYDTPNAALLASATLLRARRGLSRRRSCALCSMLAPAQVFPMLRARGGFSRRGTGFRLLPRRGRVRFLRAFPAFFLFFLRSFLDSRQLAQNFLALFRGLSTAGQLNRKDLLHNGVEFLTALHAQRLQFIRYDGKRDADRAPLVEVRANLR